MKYILISFLLLFSINSYSQTIVSKMDSLKVMFENAQRSRSDSLSKPFLFNFNTSTYTTKIIHDWRESHFSAVDTNGQLYNIILLVDMANTTTNGLAVTSWKSANAARKLIYMRSDSVQYDNTNIPNTLKARLQIIR